MWCTAGMQGGWNKKLGGGAVVRTSLGMGWGCFENLSMYGGWVRVSFCLCYCYLFVIESEVPPARYPLTSRRSPEAFECWEELPVSSTVKARAERALESCLEGASRLCPDWPEVGWDKKGGYYCVDSLSQGMPDVDKEPQQICSSSCPVCVGCGTASSQCATNRGLQWRYLEDKARGGGDGERFRVAC